MRTQMTIWISRGGGVWSGCFAGVLGNCVRLLAATREARRCWYGCVPIVANCMHMVVGRISRG
jgi:hypothetical protein